MALQTLREIGVNYDDVTASEIVAIARGQTGNPRGISWAGDGCTSFVWGVANLAGANYGSRVFQSGETFEGTRVNDAVARAVPRISDYDDAPVDDISKAFQPGRWNVWDTERYTSASSLNANNLRAGDIVRVYDTSESATTGVHSFIVSSVSSFGIMVIDNWSAGSKGISEHSISDILNSYGNTIHSAYVSRIVSNTSNTGTSNADLLLGTSTANSMSGRGGNDTIYGRRGNDTIDGGGAADDLRGGAGADRIVGGFGADTMRGGAGADVFVFNSTLETPVGAGFRDVIIGFERGSDKINLSGIDARSNSVGDQAFTWIGYSSFTNTAGQLRGTGSNIQGDTNGDGRADFEIRVTGNSQSITLSASDFIL